MEGMLGTGLTSLGQGDHFQVFGENVQQKIYIHVLLPNLLPSLSQHLSTWHVDLQQWGMPRSVDFAFFRF